MRPVLLLLIGVLLTFASHAKASDSIDQLVVKLSGEFGMWKNGSVMPVYLPSSATPKEIISQLYQSRDTRYGNIITNFQIIEIKAVQIPPFGNTNYTAVLMDTNLGQKITLLQYEQYKDSMSSWWNKTFDAKRSN
jgi:hypothetical protein